MSKSRFPEEQQKEMVALYDWYEIVDLENWMPN